MDSKKKLTPMLQQYYGLKESCDGAILFFRMGDFYELFGKDAELVAPLLNIVLTSRERGDQQKIPFCGVPHHSAKPYYIRLLNHGYKVAVAEQVQDPKEAKGLVERKITTIYTPGMIDEVDGLDKNSSNYVLSVYECPSTRKWLSLAVELSTSKLYFSSFEEFDGLLKYSLSLQPKEVWLRGFIRKNIDERFKSNGLSTHIEELSEVVLRGESLQDDFLKDFIKIEHPSHSILKSKSVKALLAATFKRIRSLGHSTEVFAKIDSDLEVNSFDLPLHVQRDLEIFETQLRRDAKGSLFAVLNKTVSPMGGRYLRDSIRSPLLDRESIEKRHQVVELFVQGGESQIAILRKQLTSIGDVERLLSRVVSGRAHPKEVFAILQSFKQAEGALIEFLDDKDLADYPLLQELQSSIRAIEPLIKLLSDSISNSPSDAELGKTFSFLKAGQNEQFDKFVDIATNGQQKVVEYLEQLKEHTGIQSLKIKEHKNFGLLVDVTKSNLKNIPDFFIRRQTMVNNERFVTEELNDLSHQLESAREHAVCLEAELYLELLRKVASHKDAAAVFTEYFAEFDMLLCFAYISLREKYCRPKIATGGGIDLMENRHPVVEQIQGKREFIPNDVSLPIHRKQQLITGPNMAGKSTIMRQIAVSAIMNQIGCFVPATSAKLPIFDQIFTRIGAADDLAQGKSTFMVEMSEAAEILRFATSKSLIILDEIGRGTSTQDGLAIAAAILSDLVQRTDSYVMFATHYHELVPFVSKFSTVQVVQTQVLQSENGIVFTHKLIEGASGNSYGLEVAKLAGLSLNVMQTAEQMLFETSQFQVNKIVKDEAEVDSAEKRKGTKLALLAGRDPSVVSDIINKIEMLKVHRLTPLAALNILNDFKTSLEQPSQLELPFDSFLDSN